MAISKTGLSGRAQLTRGAPQQGHADHQHRARSDDSIIALLPGRDHLRAQLGVECPGSAALRSVSGRRAGEHQAAVRRRIPIGVIAGHSPISTSSNCGSSAGSAAGPSSTILPSSMTNLPTAAQLFGAPPPPVDPRQARRRPGSYTVVAGANSVMNTPISRSCCAASMRPARATPPSPPPTASSTLSALATMSRR